MIPELRPEPDPAFECTWCEICDEYVLKADSFKQHDIHGKHCGWICNACWRDRPCEACGGHSRKQHVRAFTIDGDQDVTWCELAAMFADDTSALASIDCMAVGSTLYVDEENVIARMR